LHLADGGEFTIQRVKAPRVRLDLRRLRQKLVHTLHLAAGIVDLPLDPGILPRRLAPEPRVVPLPRGRVPLLDGLFESSPQECE
jgi:hypothetical protein